MTKIIKQIIYLIGTAFIFLGLFLPWRRSRNIANDAIRTVLTTHLLTYSTEVSTYIGTTMNKYRTISVFLENMNDNPKLIRCNDKLMPQLVKFVTSVSKNIRPIPYKFFVAQLNNNDEQRACQFIIDPINASNFTLLYMFELDNTFQTRQYDATVNYETWDPFTQGNIVTNVSTSEFNFSIVSAIRTEMLWSYFNIGLDAEDALPQMTVFTPSYNSNNELTSISGISFKTEDMFQIINLIPCEIINSSSLNSIDPDFVDNHKAFVKYALLIAEENTVIIEKDIGVIKPIYNNSIFPIFPTLNQLGSPFWSKLSEVIFNHKENEVFEFRFDKVLYLVVHTNVSSFKSPTNQLFDIDNTKTPGIINKIINTTETGNKTHTIITCFPVDPSIQSIYYPMSIVFVSGIAIIFVTFFLALLLINRENIWRIRKIALQTPKFKSGTNNEYFSFHQAPAGEIIDKSNLICPYLGYIPHSVVNIRNFQLEYPDDTTLNKALDNAVENLTLREDQKFSLMKKDSCEFCKYFLPEKVDFLKDPVSISTKKTPRLSRRMTGMSRRRSSNAESDDLINSESSDNDDHDYYSPKLNMNVNVEDETDESIYKIWKTKSFPFIQVMSKKDDDEIYNSHNARKGKGGKNKFIWTNFQIDQFLSEPYRMLIRYMMTLLNDCQLLLPPFDPMCVVSFLISIEKGIKNPVHAAHQLFSIHQVIYGPFNYWITNKLDILVLFFAAYFSHFDYRQYIISKNQGKMQPNEPEKIYPKNNQDDEDSTSLSESMVKSDFNLFNENDYEITLEGFKAFDDDFSKVEENLKELKRLMIQIFPIKSPLPSTENETTSQRNDSGLLDSLNSYNSDIPDSQSISSSNQNTIISDSIIEKNKSQAKGATQSKKTSSNPSSFQGLKKLSSNQRTYSNIASQETKPDSLMTPTTESETENTETQTTETMTSLSLSINGYEDESNNEKGQKSKNKNAKRKKKKNKDSFWYFWKTLKQIMFKICVGNESFDLLGSICVRIQSPYLDIHNDYGDKLMFMESVLKLCEMSAYWSPVEIMEKAIEVEDPFLFSNEEISDKLFISTFHFEYCQKIVMPWVKMLALFKPQAFEDVIKNLLDVINYWTRKKDDALDSETERESNLNDNDNLLRPTDNETEKVAYNDNDKINDTTSDDNEYNYYDND